MTTGLVRLGWAAVAAGDSATSKNDGGIGRPLGRPAGCSVSSSLPSREQRFAFEAQHRPQQPLEL
jgi:hypothetical protein